MEALSTKTLELRSAEGGSPGAHRLFYGDYGYYLDRIEREAAAGGSTAPEAGNVRDGDKTGGKGGDKTAGNNGPGANDRTGPDDKARSSATAPSGPPPAADAASPAGTGVSPSGPNPPVILIKAGQERPLTAGERREAEKQQQARVRKLRRREAEILETLETLEAEKARLENELARPEVYANGEKARSTQTRLEALAAEIETKSRDWENAAEELAGL
jgi:ATP-binding cassette subfamily F protein 3